MSADLSPGFLRRTLDALLILVLLNCLYGVFQLGTHVYARSILAQTRQKLEAENHELTQRLNTLAPAKERRP